MNEKVMKAISIQVAGIKTGTDYYRELGERMATQHELGHRMIYQLNDSEYLKITKVVFSGPATIVWFNNGNKAIVKLSKGETDDREKAILLAYFRESQGLSKTGCSKLLKKLTNEIE